MLHGRAAELGDIHGSLADARAGRSAILMIVGEAGSGKTALLEHVAADTKDFRVLRCTGVDSEAELPFAALHLLLLDCLDRLDGGWLPARTRTVGYPRRPAGTGQHTHRRGGQGAARRDRRSE